VTATKTLLSETWSVSGSITVSNGNAADLPVTVRDDGLLDITSTGPGATSLCKVFAPAGGTAWDDGSADGVVPAKDDLAFPYSCAVTDPGDVQYENSATIGYTDSDNSPKSVSINSGSFDFTNVTELGDPESVTVTDTYIGTGSPGTGTLISDTTPFTYSRTFNNPNCQTYNNTAALSSGPSDSVSVTYCGPNNGGLTMGWWQNNNGQALLKANLANACGTVTGYTGLAPAASHLINASSTSTGAFAPGSCTGPSATSNKSYLPTFTYNVVKSANASGSGAPMLLGQWLTTALDTAGYPTFTSAGRPTLSASQDIAIPTGLQSLGLAPCSTVGNALTVAVNQYGAYKANKATVTTFITLFDNLNNNRAQTCP